MSDVFLVKPSFDRFRQQIMFPARSLNAFAMGELVDNTSKYQRLFGVYNFMPLNNLYHYKLTTMSGQPFMWQPDLNCSWDDTGSVKFGQQEITPCKAKINESWCYDELFDSCFEHLLKWDGRGKINLDSNAIKLFNMLVKNLRQQALLGAMLTLTVGKLYDVNQVEFRDDVPMNIKMLFKRTMNTCRGWLELLRESAFTKGKQHMNHPDVFSESDFDGCEYASDCVALFDKIRAIASPELCCMMDEGGVIDSMNGMGQIMMLVSPSIFKCFAQAYREQCLSVTCTNPRLTMEMRDGCKVYHVDGIPIIPISHANYADKYLESKNHFAYLTVGGNISLGTSIGEVRANTNVQKGMGIIIEKATSVKEHGKYYFFSQALFATAIANSDLIAGGQIMTAA